MDAQLKRGVLNICILQLLKQSDMYGYDILKIMKSYFPTSEESTIYAILRRLNKDGLTTQYLSSISNGPPRKYYKITANGIKALEEYIVSWHYIEDVFQNIGICR